GIDNNCDDLLGDGEATPDETDADNDGAMVCDGDCDDTDNTNYPENEEICDGQDNDCNGATWADAAQEVDVDLDGYLSCVDCDDNNAEVNPAAEEICGDDLDNDCDGNVDSGFDLDGDGVPGDPCGEDCNDANSSIYPDAWDDCSDDVDSDCDGVVNDDGAGPYEMYETDLTSEGYDMSSLGPQLSVGTGTCGFTAIGADFHLAPGSGAVTGVFSSTEDVMDIYTIDTSFSGNTLVLAGFLLLDSLPVGCGEGEISWTANQPITVTADIDGQTYTSTGNTGSLPFSLALTEIFDIEYLIVVEPASSFVPTADGQCTYDYTLNFEIP
ncbi:MAG TPA: hypothetical protein DIU15_09170, partial [Deltaproteobacteria bacterium]|nr:hypothetical protein [Deltaproteobacteria bacterium]